MRIARHNRLFIRNCCVAMGLVALAALLGTPAHAYEAQVLHASASGQVEFVMPSGNIGCIYTPADGTAVYETADGSAEIACDRVEPDYVRAILGGMGVGSVLGNVGDVSCCSLGQVFKYDHYVELGPFQCLSTRKGLTCAREDGHGFFLSRALVQAK